MEFQDQNTRGNGTRVTTEQYSPQAMERIKRLLENFSRSGETKYFSILVDGEMVVAKTSDPESFDNYKDFVHDLTKEVHVRLFYGNSPNCNTYKFHLAKDPLSGVDLAEQRVTEALEKHKKEQQISELRKKNKKLKRKVATLKAELEENSNIFSIKNADKLKDTASSVFGVINSIRNPSAGTLTGVSEEAEVSFEPTVDEENLKMLETLEQKYGAEQTRGILNLVTRLAKHHDLVQSVGEALYNRESKKKKDE